MTRLDELKQKLGQTIDEAQKELNDDNIDRATELKNEAMKIKEKIALQEELDAQEKQEIQSKAAKTTAKSSSIHEFASAMRSLKNADSLTEGTGEDGGYTVPEDISTMITELREAKVSLSDLVTVETVATNSGARTYKKRSTLTGFTNVEELGEITANERPTFDRVKYTIAKYAGFLPISNELLEDADASITNTILTWIADESRATRNKLIVEEVTKKDAVEIDGLDGIKKALNVTLGQAFKPTSKIITNDDGLQYLDTLKDSNGRYLLQPMPSDPQSLQLCVGASVIPIVAVPNADLATGENGIPMIIGDLAEGIRLFDRKAVTITASEIASIGGFNAFSQDMTLYRAIERLDVETFDSDAFVNGYISTATGSEAEG